MVALAEVTLVVQQFLQGLLVVALD